MSDSDDRKRKLTAGFNALSATYDRLRFLSLSATTFVRNAGLSAGLHVLDVATGTGAAAMEAAGIVGNSGKVIGVDISPGMLERAREKAAEAGLTNLEFREGDAERLEFPDGSFDAVLCASSLFFLPDMPAVVREWKRVLKPGGMIGILSFGQTFLEPYKKLWTACLLRHDLEASFLPTQRLSEPALCRYLMLQADLRNVEIKEEQLGYFQTPEERWEDIMSGFEGKPLLSLPPQDRESFRTEHLSELKTHAGPQGLWVDVPALLVYGR